MQQSEDLHAARYFLEGVGHEVTQALSQVPDLSLELYVVGHELSLAVVQRIVRLLLKGSRHLVEFGHQWF